MGRPKTISDDALLAAARAVFVAAGEGGSTKEIARRAGISEAAVFKRFATKAALFAAAMAPPRFDVARLADCVAAASGPRIALTMMAEVILTHLRAALPVLVRLGGPAEGREPAGGADLAAIVGAVAAYLAEQSAAGRVGTVNATAAADVLVGSVYAIAHGEVVSGRPAGDARAAVRPVVDVIWTGLRAD